MKLILVLFKTNFGYGLGEILAKMRFSMKLGLINEYEVSFWAKKLGLEDLKKT